MTAWPWSVRTEKGQATWVYQPPAGAAGASGTSHRPHASLDAAQLLFPKPAAVNSSDAVLRSQMLGEHPPETPLKFNGDAAGLPGAADEIGAALRKGLDYYARVQMDDGHWAGDYGGPMFLLPGMVFACHITGQEIPPERRAAALAYIFNMQHAEEHGWGLHIEDRSTVFGTTLNYAAARLLGADASDARMVRARAFLHRHGGAAAVPSWGKFWLCVMGLYEYDGLNPVCPDLWLLPEWFPFFHPSRMWCHCRQVYLPMGYLYGHRVVARDAATNPVLVALREELYVEAYDEIDWPSCRNRVAEVDIFHRHTRLLDWLHVGLGWWERIVPSFLRNRALKECLHHVEFEDEATDYICIGPVNKFLNMVVRWHSEQQAQAEAAESGSAAPGVSSAMARHVERIDYYVWISEDGLKLQGYNGSFLWDTSFAVDAFLVSGFAERYRPTLELAHDFLEIAQIKDDVPDGVAHYRHPTRGSFGFSSAAQGWPTGDCTAEGLRAECELIESGFVRGRPIPRARLFDAINVLLTFQNADGGWSTYEAKRGGDWYEWINPSEVFGRIMVDYSYPECSASAISAMRVFQRLYPDHRRADLEKSIERGVAYMRKEQRADGSWYASWGVCFTYGTCFCLEALIMAGASRDDDAVQRGADFLVSVQRADGGWGEDFESCRQAVYVQGPSNVVNTAWALLGLMQARNSLHVASVARGIRYLISAQETSGDFPQGQITGVFNGSAAITYINYRNAWPLRALGIFRTEYAHAFPTAPDMV